MDIPTAEIPALEPTFADMMTAIANATDITPQQKVHWSTSLRQIANGFGQPLESLPGRLTAVRLRLAQLHHVKLGVTPKTLSNHKSNCQAALRWFGKETDTPARGAPLLPIWERLNGAIADKGVRARLYALMRFCSARRITPDAVMDTTVADFMAYRAQFTRLKATPAAARSIARSWNACVKSVPGWPATKLTEPPLKAANRLAWEAVPVTLRHQLDEYLTSLTRAHKGRNGRRFRPISKATLRTRRAEIVAFLRKVVQLGVPVESLTDLSKLLDPDLVEKAIDAYWAKDEEPTVYTIDLGWKLLRMAQVTGALDEDGLHRLDELRASLEEYRRTGLTTKNMALVRQVLAQGVWQAVCRLPDKLMARAYDDLPHAPVKAAINAQIAVAIAILVRAPIRLANLISIELGTHLTKPGLRGGCYFLHFDAREVKNKVDLDFPLDDDVTALIDKYVQDFRPVLMRGHNGLKLFPGEDGDSKTKATLGEQMSHRIHDELGLTITVHQFRHAAAAIYLKHHPGNYETVRRLLGHKNIGTTMSFYAGLGTIQASEVYGKIIGSLVRDDLIREGEEL